MWDEDEDTTAWFTESEQCGDVDRENVEDQLVQDKDPEPLSGTLTFG
jgi:hypothetical protein